MSGVLAHLARDRGAIFDFVAIAVPLLSYLLFYDVPDIFLSAKATRACEQYHNQL